MEEVKEKSKIRVRINVSTSVKGVKTYDGTVELIDVVNSDLTIQDVETMTTICLVEHDKLIAKLDERYPAGNIGGVAQITLDDAPNG